MWAALFQGSQRRTLGALAIAVPAVSAIAFSAATALEEGAVVLTRGTRAPEPISEETRARLLDGVFLYQHARANSLLQSEFNERYEALAQPVQLRLYEEGQRFDDLFLAGDDSFAFEFDRWFGGGRAGVPLVPTAPQPVHDGLGGADGASCRACHFVGGPDGAGTSTQRAYFRGDGRRTSSAVVRDAPHLMGLGVVERLAREMEGELAVVRQQARDAAMTATEDTVFPLSAKGISFGVLIAQPGGMVDTSRVEGVSPDLRVRPFGHKGRHADLVELADEALQVHLGIQTSSFLTRQREAGAPVGDGPATDPDEDGVEVFAVWRDGVEGAEASSAHSLLLAGYMALIGLPEIHPPQSPDLLTRWVEGRRLLDSVGCTRCHVEQLMMEDDTVRLTSRLDPGLQLTLPLSLAGRAPLAIRTDYSPGSSQRVGTPVFLYSDLKRHDLGPALADGVEEALPDGGGDVDGAQWLTRSLWGVADTAPYLHDGRAATLHDAIVAHGGEAASARDAYLALPDAKQGALRLFLASLTRQETVLVE